MENQTPVKKSGINTQLVIILILAILLVIFTLQNQEKVSLKVFFWTINSIPVALLLVITVLLGYLIPYFLLIPRIWKLKRELVSARKEKEELVEAHEQPVRESRKTDPEGVAFDDEEEDQHEVDLARKKSFRQVFQRIAVMPFESLLLATACCPPVLYFAKILSHEKVYIEQREHFIKQTFRNRYSILSPNGQVDLIVPVEHGRSPGLKIRDVRIAYHTEWQRNHWRTICTAYNNSPWFRDMEDEIKPYYIRKWEYLFDFNQAYLKTILDLLSIRKEINLTHDFEMVPGSYANFREVISPKKDSSQWDPGYKQPAYTQVFSDKFPFVAGLSILDLLFNEGPVARDKLLQKSKI